MVSIERKKERNPFYHLDFILIFLVLTINAIGLAVLYSYSFQKGEMGLFNKQLLASLIGFFCMCGILFIDYKDLRILGFPAYAGVIFLLLLVLVIGTGKEEVGMSGWLILGRASIQPSEFGKITTIILSAWALDKINQKGRMVDFLVFLGIAFLPVALVAKQPDFGTSIVYVFFIVVMVFVWGIKFRYIGILIASFVIVISLFISSMDSLLKPYQIDRIKSFINPTAYSRDAYYQVNMAIRAIGSGQYYGLGLGKDAKTTHIPAAETDMIFASLGQKMGFIWTITIVVLFTLLLLRLIYVAVTTRDRFGAYILMGIMSVFLFHFAENVGMNLGLLPVTGIPLPFMSYGGSSVIANYISIGVACSISMRRGQPVYESG
jgi:rod shape determining protein RodA